MKMRMYVYIYIYRPIYSFIDLQVSTAKSQSPAAADGAAVRRLGWPRVPTTFCQSLMLPKASAEAPAYITWTSVSGPPLSNSIDIISGASSAETAKFQKLADYAPVWHDWFRAFCH